MDPDPLSSWICIYNKIPLNPTCFRSATLRKCASPGYEENGVDYEGQALPALRTREPAHVTAKSGWFLSTILQKLAYIDHEIKLVLLKGQCNETCNPFLGKKTPSIWAITVYLKAKTVLQASECLRMVLDYADTVIKKKKI